MGYQVAFIDTDKPLKSFKEYDCLYGGIPVECYTNDYSVASEPLQGLFMELKEFLRPLNGKFAASREEVDNGEYLDADYAFSTNVIWLEVAFRDIDALYPKLIELSQKHNVAFYDTNGRVIPPAKKWKIAERKEFDRRNGTALCLVCILSVLLLICIALQKWYWFAIITIIYILIGLITTRWINRAYSDMHDAYLKMID